MSTAPARERAAPTKRRTCTNTASGTPEASASALPASRPSLPAAAGAARRSPAPAASHRPSSCRSAQDRRRTAPAAHARRRRSSMACRAPAPARAGRRKRHARATTSASAESRERKARTRRRNTPSSMATASRKAASSAACRPSERGVPGQVAVAHQRSEVQRLPAAGRAVVDLIDSADQHAVEFLGDGGRQRLGAVRLQQGAQGGLAMVLPDQAGGAEGRAVLTRGAPRWWWSKRWAAGSKTSPTSQT
jgi:hypothetical protein